MADADQFEQKWEEVNIKKRLITQIKISIFSELSNKRYQLANSNNKVTKVNWRWSRVLGYHVPDAHDAL